MAWTLTEGTTTKRSSRSRKQRGLPWTARRCSRTSSHLTQCLCCHLGIVTRASGSWQRSSASCSLPAKMSTARDRLLPRHPATQPCQLPWRRSSSSSSAKCCYITSRLSSRGSKVGRTRSPTCRSPRRRTTMVATWALCSSCWPCRASRPEGSCSQRRCTRSSHPGRSPRRPPHRHQGACWESSAAQASPTSGLYLARRDGRRKCILTLASGGCRCLARWARGQRRGRSSGSLRWLPHQACSTCTLA
mmetsp:Transcript_15981/g.47423  ORF Transcript_15981/g.47423 Transcript_15981/m.47423 type:complete len:247 (-) Transcript_15981:2974-3714(-)